jgi:hypothetical protein
MRDKFLIAAAAAALLAFPAAAQVSGAGSPATGAPTGAVNSAVDKTDTPPPVNPMPGDPAPSAGAPRSSSPASSSAAAQTGTAVNTSATEADLRTGATVRDSAGMEVGTISKVTKGKTGAMVTLSSGGKTVTVPASSLTMSNGSLTASVTKEDLWAPK